jgi:hypothetical protein
VVQDSDGQKYLMGDKLRPAVYAGSPDGFGTGKETAAKLRRGRVIVSFHGEIDFSRDDIPIEICKELYEKGFPYLELTEFGKKELLNIAPKAVIVETSKPSRKRKSSD